MLLRRLCFAAATAHAFVLPPAPRTTRLQMMPPKPGDMTPESMRQAADCVEMKSRAPYAIAATLP